MAKRIGEIFKPRAPDLVIKPIEQQIMVWVMLGVLQETLWCGNKGGLKAAKQRMWNKIVERNIKQTEQVVLAEIHN